MGSQPGYWSCLPGDGGNVWRHFWLSQHGTWGGAVCIEASEVARKSTVHSTASIAKNFPAPHDLSAKIRTLCEDAPERAAWGSSG